MGRLFNPTRYALRHVYSRIARHEAQTSNLTDGAGSLFSTRITQMPRCVDRAAGARRALSTAVYEVDEPPRVDLDGALGAEPRAQALGFAELLPLWRAHGASALEIDFDNHAAARSVADFAAAARGEGSPLALRLELGAALHRASLADVFGATCAELLEGAGRDDLLAREAALLMLRVADLASFSRAERDAHAARGGAVARAQCQLADQLDALDAKTKALRAVPPGDARRAQARADARAAEEAWAATLLLRVPFAFKAPHEGRTGAEVRRGRPPELARSRG